MIKEGLLSLSRSSLAETLVKETPLRAMSRRFVPGETLDALLEAARKANEEGLKVTANYLGEEEHDRASAEAAVETYVGLVDRIQEEGLDAGLSVKPSQLGETIGRDFLLENLTRILHRAGEAEVFVRLDMESSEHTEATLEAFEELWSRGHRGVGVVLQAYLRRTEGDIRRMNELGASVRLCKGAYSEPKDIAYQGREKVKERFRECMKLLLTHGTRPAIATHDDELIRATSRFAAHSGTHPESFEFQMLHGVRRDLQRRLVSDGWRIRVYIPFGESWYPYLARRLAERPANILLLAGSVIRESPVGFLLPDSNGGER
ncbi:MAG: proline dehydrogenase family protein [Longimicrobiales bacterium]|nr:proline dehydrogenase family protein [Longimicrobiales bacterium]